MTQEYTPVDWVDETAGQPGTLINKARLDQMQTAHHFADGFEEVDAVPTADPQVDYHKVVYCTADSTFYRWDGIQWTKDIDDDTKQLLLDHEADHNNPHVVTKAQVGLGNVDNTSDADKPVSDAVQSALDDKLDDSQLVSAWQGTPDNDHIPTEKLVKDSLDGKVPMTLKTSGVWFYAQVSSGTVQYQGTSGATGGITSVPMRDSSGRIKTAAPSANDDAANKKYVDDLGASKLDDSQLVTSWGGTPSDSKIPSEKLVKDIIDGVAADLATHEADTANPHSVTKAQVGLGNVDNKGTVSSWQGTPDNDHIPTEKLVKDSLGDGSVTKVGTATVGGNLKPVYLNAGAPTAVADDLVSTSGAQTVNGVKTYTSRGIYKVTTASWKGPTSTYYLGNAIEVVDGDGDYVAQIYPAHDANGRNHFDLISRAWDDNQGTNAYRAIFSIAATAGGSMYMTGPSRTYSASNTSDVVTIGSLQASTDVVHTSGNETILGYKDFLYLVRQKNSNVTGNTSPATYQTGIGFRVVGDDTGNVIDVGWEKATTPSSRVVLRAYGNKDAITGNQTQMQIHFIFDEVNGQIRMQTARVDKDGNRTFNTAQVLQSWTV